MSKLKLNIQRFSATNHTAHYNLSQYISTDKPTYLIDYNSDMLAIDTAIYNAMSKATVNETNIGTMENLTTTAKTDLVSALNEVNSQVGTNTSNISQNTSDISTLGGNQGDLANLTTTTKSNLVSAINEVKSVNDTQTTNISKNATDIANIKNLLNLKYIQTYSLSDVTNKVNISSTTSGNGLTVTVAQDETGEIFKVYGNFVLVRADNSGNNFKFTLPNALRKSPDTAYTIVSAGYAVNRSSNTIISSISLTVNTDGSITVEGGMPGGNNNSGIIFPCLYFNSDFGDEPFVPPAE